MEEGGKSSFLIMGKTPCEEGDSNTMIKDGMEGFKRSNTVVVQATSHANSAEALHIGSGDIFQEPCREFWRKKREIFTDGRGKGMEAAFFASFNIDAFFVAAFWGEKLGATGGSGDDARVTSGRGRAEASSSSVSSEVDSSTVVSGTGIVAFLPVGRS